MWQKKPTKSYKTANPLPGPSVKMNEDELIQNFFASSVHQEGVVVGIGDDAAVLELPPGHQLVSSVDTLLEGVHFPVNFSAEDLARRAVAVCVSDLAAMGAQAKWMTMALSLPSADTHWLLLFSNALHQECEKYSMQLVGGDTVKGKLAVTINVLGVVKNGQALRRDTAQLDDIVYVSGSLGGAALALSQILKKTDLESDLLNCFTQPTARIELGRSLIGIANSCMDVSDGVLLDTARLAKASNLGVQIDLDKLPLNPGLHKMSFDESMEFASFGDDYELLFTVASHKIDGLNSIAENLNLALTPIGRIIRKPGLVTLYQGDVRELKSSGYQHFE